MTRINKRFEAFWWFEFLNEQRAFRQLLVRLPSSLSLISKGNGWTAIVPT